MTEQPPKPDDLRDLCGEVGDDDNLDPKEFFDRRKAASGGARNGGRKTLQLCRQVQKALSYAMGETGDDVLLEMHVESVAPAPNDKRMMVSVSSMGDAHDPADVLTRLQFATPFLRNAVAAAIHRKRVPELLFQFLPPEVPESR